MYAVNLFRFSLVLLLALSPSVVLAQASPEQLQAAELAKLAGDWTVVSDFVNGQPDDTRVGAIVKIIGDELVRTSPGASNRVARLSVDPSLTPKGIDIHWTAGRFQGETFYGIFKLDGNRLYICSNRTGNKRPKQFESAPDKVEALITLERIGTN
jgi:uncharacterized protein (TIGR03067 family)